MASVLSKGTLFPAELTRDLVNLVRGKSSLAVLSGQTPVSFVGNDVFTFNFDNEVDLVAENGAKSNGGAEITPVTIRPVKIEYGFRTSDEFMTASEEYQLEILRAFSDGFAAKAARGLDIMAMHGVNPRTGSAAAVIGTNHFDSQVAQTVTATASANADVESAVALVQANEHEITGAAISPKLKGDLAQEVYTGSGLPMFPELAWGGSPESIHGLRTEFNGTVSFGSTPVDYAILGNFRDFFRWGTAKDVKIEVIEYGNPDNDSVAGDLKGHNQVYLRGEMYIGWGILVPDAFARIIP